MGVAPQYCGTQGKTANCQSGVFICYSSAKGHALLTVGFTYRRAGLDRLWERRRLCRIPKDTVFQTKQELAIDLLPLDWRPNSLAARWIACDCSFGNNEWFLEQLPNDLFWRRSPAREKSDPKVRRPDRQLKQDGCTVEQLIQVKELWNWQTHKIAEGQKGPLVAAFARIRVYLSPERTPESQRWLLLRNDANCKIKYALSNAPQETPMREMVRVSCSRWPIERFFRKTNLSWDWITTNTAPGPPGIGTCAWSSWHNYSCCVCKPNLKKSSRLTLPQARLLIERSFPQPKGEITNVLIVLHTTLDAITRLTSPTAKAE